MKLLDIIPYVRDEVKIIYSDGCHARLFFEGKAGDVPMRLAYYTVCDIYAEEDLLTIVTGGLEC